MEIKKKIQNKYCYLSTHTNKLFDLTVYNMYLNKI